MPSVKRSPLRRLATPWRIADAVPAARALHRPLVDREHHRVALPQRHDLAARLHARALLDQQELAAVKSAPGWLSRTVDLQREHELAVEILVQAVVVARPVAQQQRRRPLLAAGWHSRSQASRAAGKRSLAPAPRSSGWPRRPAPDRAPGAAPRPARAAGGEILVSPWP